MLSSQTQWQLPGFLGLQKGHQMFTWVAAWGLEGIL
jgi:hypothetical protein